VTSFYWILAEGVGFLETVENIQYFPPEWQTLARTVSLYCLKVCGRWQTEQGGLIERVGFDSLTIRQTHGAPGVTQK
jgi:hypothetical protein